MELRGENVVLSDGGDEGRAVVGGGGDHGRVGGNQVIRVDEVDVGIGGKVFEERRVGGWMEGVPAHVRDLEVVRGAVDGEADDFADDEAQALVEAVFFAEVGEELEAQADAEERFAGLGEVFDGAGEVSGVEDFHGVLKGSDAGNDELIGRLDLLGSGDDLRGITHTFKGLLNAAEIGHAVVDDR